MPSLPVCQKRHSVALFGSGQEGRGAALHPFGFFKGRYDLAEVVSIDGDGMPAKPGELPCVGLHVPTMHGLLALSQAIDIDDGHQVVQPVVTGHGRGLPHRPFGAFAVSHQHKGPAAGPIQVFGAQGHPYPHR